MEQPHVAQRFPYVQDTAAGSYWWCACGRSNTQPFCDGSHKGTGLAPTQVDLSQAGKVAWCGCKHSKQGARCDGTHRTLP